VRVRKRTTGASFWALVPFVDLVRHRPGAGGNVTLELDNTISVSLTAHAQVRTTACSELSDSCSSSSSSSTKLQLDHQ
jgi:hypothetical protein